MPFPGNLGEEALEIFSLKGQLSGEEPKENSAQ
jgi:hypothetical protein